MWFGMAESLGIDEPAGGDAKTRKRVESGICKATKKVRVAKGFFALLKGSNRALVVRILGMLWIFYRNLIWEAPILCKATMWFRYLRGYLWTLTWFGFLAASFELLPLCFGWRFAPIPRVFCKKRDLARNCKIRMAMTWNLMQNLGSGGSLIKTSFVM